MITFSCSRCNVSWFRLLLLHLLKFLIFYEWVPFHNIRFISWHSLFLSHLKTLWLMSLYKLFLPELTAAARAGKREILHNSMYILATYSMHSLFVYSLLQIWSVCANKEGPDQTAHTQSDQGLLCSHMDWKYVFLYATWRKTHNLSFPRTLRGSWEEKRFLSRML